MGSSLWAFSKEVGRTCAYILKLYNSYTNAFNKAMLLIVVGASLRGPICPFNCWTCLPNLTNGRVT